MEGISDDVLLAQNDETCRNAFIERHETYILKTTARISGHYTTKQDDRWSVALSAFDEAIRSYSPERGAFLPFAELVMKRRLYDFNRAQIRVSREIALDPVSFSNEADGEEEDTALKREVLGKLYAEEEHSAKWEIEAISSTLKRYGFTFFDLAADSPKAEKTKQSCALAIRAVADDEELLARMRKTGNLPVTALCDRLPIPPKILERHRKYIIAAIEIVCGDCPILAGYLKYVKEVL